jgi:hypothetical protein
MLKTAPQPCKAKPIIEVKSDRPCGIPLWAQDGQPTAARKMRPRLWWNPSALR